MQTIECSLAQLQPALRDQITAQLSSNENILFCCETRGVDFFEGKPSFAYVISQHRVAQAQINSKYKYRTAASSMFLTDIVSVNEGKDNFSITVWIKGHGDNDLHFYFQEGPVASKFAKILREIVNQVKTMVSQAQVSPADRLRELTKLHNEGFITDIEFEQKRKEILSKL